MKRSNTTLRPLCRPMCASPEPPPLPYLSQNKSSARLQLPARWRLEAILRTGGKSVLYGISSQKQVGQNAAPRKSFLVKTNVEYVLDSETNQSGLKHV